MGQIRWKTKDELVEEQKNSVPAIDVLGQALVEKELQILQLQQDNAMLGQTLVELELCIMQLEQGGITS